VWGWLNPEAERGRVSRSEVEEGIMRLILLLEPEESARLRRRWRKEEPAFQLASFSSAPEALACVREGHADAIICDLAILLGEPGAVLLSPRESAQAVPVVALVPPGMELSAAILLEEGKIECVRKTGNFERLLAARLRRLLQATQAQTAPAGPEAKPPPLDPEELGVILRHEINNPLTGILGNAELVLEASEELDPVLRQRLETIVSLAVRLRDLIRNLEQMLNGKGAEGSPAPLRFRSGRS
jgi:signal transduction histidine kinase